MIASDPIRTLQRSCKPGAVHIWVPALRGGRRRREVRYRLSELLQPAFHSAPFSRCGARACSIPVRRQVVDQQLERRASLR